MLPTTRFARSWSCCCFDLFIYRQNEGNLNNKDVKKAMAKAVKKKEKAEKKAQEDYQREVRKAREEQRLEEQRKKDEERALKLREEEERQRQEEEERLRQEEEEYKKWEQYIVLEGEGTDAKEDFFADEERVSKFITYLTTSKVCVLDEVAAEFGMKGDEVLTIIERLEKEGRMTVLVDDRGKLIVVTAEELAAVAEVIKKEGRVALSHLTKLCGGLVRLNLHVCSTNKIHGQ